MTVDLRAAYGQTFRFEEPVPDLAPAGDAPGEPICVTQPGNDPAPELLEILDDRHAHLLYTLGRQLRLDREARTAEIVGEPFGADVLAHPALSPIAAVFARWEGKETFHAGSFIVGDRAFGLIGDREAGKSTLLAALAAGGVTVMTDDLMVCGTEGTHAGPRSIDLRAQPGGPARQVRDWSRWRIELKPAPMRAPLGGWVFLKWSEVGQSLERLPAADVLARLASVRTLGVMASDPRLLLDLAARPAWTLRRPRDASLIDGTVERLCSLRQ